MPQGESTKQTLSVRTSRPRKAPSRCQFVFVSTGDSTQCALVDRQRRAFPQIHLDKRPDSGLVEDL